MLDLKRCFDSPFVVVFGDLRFEVFPEDETHFVLLLKLYLDGFDEGVFPEVDRLKSLCRYAFVRKDCCGVVDEVFGLLRKKRFKY